MSEVDESSSDILAGLLFDDLNFHGENSNYASHNFHSFPAKFPPQLPEKFIRALTKEGDTVLDPMMGSGTTLVAAFELSRRGIGFDIDPLALRLTKVKTTPLPKEAVRGVAAAIIAAVRQKCEEDVGAVEREFESEYLDEKREFLDYWYAKQTQLELFSLAKEIRSVNDPSIKTFLEIALSGTIVTKSGGVSLALDLAHTRPHKAKVVYGLTGEVLRGRNSLNNPSPRLRYVTKRLRSTIDEFEKRCARNLQSLPESSLNSFQPTVNFGDAQALPLEDCSVDLVVTSPPYASNAIDYMRAHKFSLLWLGHDYHALGELRGKYIGGEATTHFSFENLPDLTMSIINKITSVDKRKGLVLHRYYSEMLRVLREMYRVLRPGHSSIVVVGNSMMRGVNTETSGCLAEIGVAVGFAQPMIGERSLDRDRRMLPAGKSIDKSSQIQQRMHKEYVLALTKPKD